MKRAVDHSIKKYRRTFQLLGEYDAMNKEDRKKEDARVMKSKIARKYFGIE